MLFNTVSSFQGDITYIQSSNTIFTSESPGHFRHYDISGTLLAETPHPPGTSCLGTFCSNGIIYACIYY